MIFANLYLDVVSTRLKMAPWMRKTRWMKILKVMQYDSNNESDVDEVESRVNFPRARIEQCDTGKPEEKGSNL